MMSKRKATLNVKDLEKLRIQDLKEYLNSREDLRNKNQFSSLIKKRFIFIPGLIILRLFLIGETIYFFYFYVCLLNDYFILFNLILTILIVMETLFLLTFHEGRDFYWVSVSTAAFILSSIIILWSALKRILSMVGSNPCSPKFDQDSYNLTRLQELTKKCSGINFTDNICEFFYFMVAMYLILLMINKITTPFSRKLKAKDHTTFAASLLSLSADMFDYVSNMEIIDLVGFDAIFALLTMSSIQFYFNLTATKKIKAKIKKKSIYYLSEFIFSTETWTILLGLFTQEIPCLILRSYALSKLGFFNNPSIYFFAFKNALMILIYIYKLIVEYYEFKSLRKTIKTLIDKEEEKNKFGVFDSSQQSIHL